MDIYIKKKREREGERGKKSSSHLANLDGKQNFCHVNCSLEKVGSVGLIDYSSTGIIKKPDSPSHFHLPPSAHALLTWESFPLPPSPC